MTDLEIKELLDYWAKEVEENSFIPHDPVQIPHRYTRRQDIEISGFFAAIMAWGQRKTIINSAQKLMLMMDDVPFDFVMQHEERDLKRMESFVHRTLNGQDVISLIRFFKHCYGEAPSLEDLFFARMCSRRPMRIKFLEHWSDFKFHGKPFLTKNAPINTWHHHQRAALVND